MCKACTGVFIVIRASKPTKVLRPIWPENGKSTPGKIDVAVEAFIAISGRYRRSHAVNEVWIGRGEGEEGNGTGGVA